ncbi:hypothetical protein [Parapedobacter tibetensis]|uniref:hypothetical protein n=1 Tax=Parapedobacter tibetensis TaxID=2972951 RepID=UPI00214D649A|nr:hypothetical protein [Parapedobacter tibetensis]
MGDYTRQWTRRKILTAFGLGGLALGRVSGKSPVLDKEAGLDTFHTVQSMVNSFALREGNIVRTLGYREVGDLGGAMYRIVKETAGQDDQGVGRLRLANGQMAELINADAVNYQMFGAIGDGHNDDGKQVKEAHDYANRMQIPVINMQGEFWIKETTDIIIQTNVQWGHSVFYIDESFNSRTAPRFTIKSRKTKKTIEWDAATKRKFLDALKPGMQIFPELAPFRNSLINVRDENDRIGFRAVKRDREQSNAREELFYVEEHGRIIGDIAWTFNDYTSLVAYPCDDNYLVVDGGTFYLSGSSPGRNYEGYWKNGFSVTRSRTIIRNQWVGLEESGRDKASDPRSGFYSFSMVYDITLENVRLLPWEKDRGNSQENVPAGTYGISASRMINGTFRNVTAEGGPVHWGVFGTNVNKNFRIYQCRLNRVDVHFHCWNLLIQDSTIGYRGISVTGGGDLVIENSTCHSRNFINFRRDYGAKWDGNIRLNNCRFIPASYDPTGVLAFMPADFNYRYPIGIARSIHVEDLVIDFSAVPSSTAPCWLVSTSGFSKTSTGARLFFPENLIVKNVMVIGREQGIRLMEISNPESYFVQKLGMYDEVSITTNSRIWFENIQLEKLSGASQGNRRESHLSVRSVGPATYLDGNSLYLDIRIHDCQNFVGVFNGCIARLVINHTTVAALHCTGTDGMSGSVSFQDCAFLPVFEVEKPDFYRLATTLGTSFVNCMVHVPKIGGALRPDLLSGFDFIAINKFLKYNHVNTRLGRDLIKYCEDANEVVSNAFIAMLKNHHDMEDNHG